MIMRTALFDKHRAHGAKMVEFCGWEMPIQYSGIIEEHKKVRESAGLFDVSHMGRIDIVGLDAERFLDYLSTNVIAGKKDLSCTYTVWCRRDGSSIDDVLVFRKNAQSFFIVVNAGNREKDLAHLKNEAASYNVAILPHFDDQGILAIQGPQALKIIPRLFPAAKDLKPMTFAITSFEGKEVIVSRTGYTGSPGFETYASNTTTTRLWDSLLKNSDEGTIAPVGLGARDTLRLEMGYALYGHELSDTIAASESVAAWTVKMSHDFLGKRALLDLDQQAKKRMEYGLVLQGAGVAREGYPIFSNGQEIGKVTSGTFSPTLNKGIAIALVSTQLTIGDAVEIQIRSQRVKAVVASLPFVKLN